MAQQIMQERISELLTEAEIITEQVGEYFEDKSDADHDGENFIPNKEMTLSIRLDDLQHILNQIRKQIR